MSRVVMKKTQREIITVGAGDIDQLTLGIYKRIKYSQQLFLRTKEHPVVDHLAEEVVHYLASTDVYEKHDSFESVYEEITETLLDKATVENVLYAVPGHPMVAEKAVQLLLERGPGRGINIKVSGGQSFIDSLFT